MKELSGCALAFLWLALAVSCSGNGTGNNPIGTPSEADLPRASDQAAAFADSNLEVSIRRALGKPNGALTGEQLRALTKLQARERGIAELGGIGQLENLQILDLARNEIGDIDSLASLVHLTFLDLEGNGISDIAALSALKNLQILVLDNNAVADISPLLELPALSSVELAGNPLDETSLDGHLEALRQRAVEVTLNIVENTEVEEDEVPPPPAIPGRIAFSATPEGDADIYVINADGDKWGRMINDLAHETEPTWSPDGRKIAFVRGNARGDILVMEADETGGKNVKFLTVGGGDNRSPAWSPDGQKIAFVRSTSATFENIHVMDAYGENVVRLSHANWNESSPTWSPDSQRIAFATRRESGPQQIFAMNVDGSGLIQLTRAVEDIRSPGWSPNGDELIFTMDINPTNGVFSFRVFKLLLEGTMIEAEKFVQISDEGYDLDPAWSPDGKMTVFVSNPWEGSLFVGSADGSGADKVIDMPGIRDPVWTSVDW